MPFAALYTVQPDSSLSKARGSDLSAVSRRDWRFIIPIPGQSGASDLVAFARDEVAFFKNDGKGRFNQVGEAIDPRDKSLDVQNLEIGRNVCAGHFKSNRTVELVAECEFNRVRPRPPRKFGVWNLKLGALTRTTRELVLGFPWDDANKHVQHIVAGKFFQDAAGRYSLDDLLFYQGNSNQNGDTGALQLIKFGSVIDVSLPRLTRVRSTWSTLLACSPFKPNRLLCFDDGTIVTNHRGRRFGGDWPYNGPNPTSPWVEVRVPGTPGHLRVAHLDPQPPQDEGPTIANRSEENPKDITNRQLAASPSPFLPFENPAHPVFSMSKVDPAEDPSPENLDWWNLPGRTDHCRFYSVDFPQEGCILRLFRDISRAKPRNRYQVMNKNLQLLSNGETPDFPVNPLDKAVIPGNFITSNKHSDLLLHSKD